LLTGITAYGESQARIKTKYYVNCLPNWCADKREFPLSEIAQLAEAPGSSPSYCQSWGWTKIPDTLKVYAKRW